VRDLLSLHGVGKYGCYESFSCWLLCGERFAPAVDIQGANDERALTGQLGGGARANLAAEQRRADRR
jgi:hypothetical protein